MGVYVLQARDGQGKGEWEGHPVYQHPVVQLLAASLHVRNDPFLVELEDLGAGGDRDG